MQARSAAFLTPGGWGFGARPPARRLRDGCCLRRREQIRPLLLPHGREADRRTSDVLHLAGRLRRRGPDQRSLITRGSTFRPSYRPPFGELRNLSEKK